jgi:hypothetical protein
LRPGRPGVIAQENLRRRQENEPAAKIEAGGMVPLCPQSMKGTIFFTGFSPFFIPADSTRDTLLVSAARKSEF